MAETYPSWEVTPEKVERGRALECRRTALGLTQQDFAALVGVSQTYISHMERGTRKISDAAVDVLARVEFEHREEVAQMLAGSGLPVFMAGDGIEARLFNARLAEASRATGAAL